MTVVSAGFRRCASLGPPSITNGVLGDYSKKRGILLSPPRVSAGVGAGVVSVGCQFVHLGNHSLYCLSLVNRGISSELLVVALSKSMVSVRVGDGAVSKLVQKSRKQKNETGVNKRK